MTEVDFNEFDYNMDLKYGRRTFKQLYLSYIRLKYPLLYYFYDYYNITTIKFILYLQSF